MPKYFESHIVKQKQQKITCTDINALPELR